MTTPKVTIIIPVYGVERYIERCVHSLFEQTLEELEYIFVNDSTKDNSIEIIRTVLLNYPQRQNQVKIVNHDVNKGLPVARRTGLQYATGEYVMHCDSDDWLDINAADSLYKKAKESEADFIICDFFSSDGNENILRKACSSTDKNQLLIDMLNGKSYWSVWNKLVKRSLYDSVQIWTDRNVCEDMVLMIQLLLEAANIKYIEKPLYYYYQNTESMTRVVSKEGTIRRFNEAVYNATLVKDYLCSKTKAQPATFRDALDNMLFRQRNLITVVPKDRDTNSLWRNTFKELNCRVLFNRCISVKTKTKFYLALVGLYNKHIS